ncbi:forkhead box protein K2 [Drosophila innubila]|uniref:forkhead box protein K2 n=1 Tax=Drosophila innubila TaxID=198719 RepID=UPI00148D2728|nr:forkhead box protein K2 [Drosophila innubila]
MANTDLSLSQASSCGQQHNESQSHSGRCGSSPKPHFMTGVYPLCVSASASASSAVSAPRQTPSTALEQYRLQLYNYALNIERLRCPQYGAGAGSVTGSSVMAPWLHPYSPLHCAGAGGVGVGIGIGGSRLATLSTISLFPQSQRIFQPEEPKPQHSYIGLIAMAILSSTEMKLVLSDIYQYILDNYAYFRTRGPGWRNSIRHNLSLNDCFIKSGRSANGKGHYWAIHPANMDDFRKGDFRRRKAQRKVRKHMGLSVDDASTDSPSPPPLDLTTPPPLGTAQASLQLAALNYPYHQHYIGQFFGRTAPQYTTTSHHLPALDPIYQHSQHPHAQVQLQPHPLQNPHAHAHAHPHPHPPHHQHIAYINSTTTTTIANLYSQTRKRQFDVASLLAPDVQIVDIVEDEEKTTQHTVITKVQVQKQQTIHHELVVEQSAANHQLDAETEADIDEHHSASISPVLGGSSVASSSQHDSNSLEELPTGGSSTLTSPLPLAMTMSLPKTYVELNHVDPHILSRYYGSYMAAAARRATIEASRAQSKSMTTPPSPKELLPNKL